MGRDTWGYIVLKHWQAEAIERRASASPCAWFGVGRGALGRSPAPGHVPPGRAHPAAAGGSQANANGPVKWGVICLRPLDLAWIPWRLSARPTVAGDHLSCSHALSPSHLFGGKRALRIICLDRCHWRCSRASAWWRILELGVRWTSCSDAHPLSHHRLGPTSCRWPLVMHKRFFRAAYRRAAKDNRALVPRTHPPSYGPSLPPLLERNSP
jgi:hypothetical protein